LIQAAQGATKKRGSFFRAKYNTLKFRLGSANKAKVAIANRLARTIFKVLGGANYKDIGYMRGDPREGQIEKMVRKLRAMGVDIQHQNHQMIVSTNRVSVEQTGIVIN
jgi:transposase